MLTKLRGYDFSNTVYLYGNPFTEDSCVSSGGDREWVLGIATKNCDT